jgi:hypothetical protein
MNAPTSKIHGAIGIAESRLPNLQDTIGADNSNGRPFLPSSRKGRPPRSRALDRRRGRSNGSLTSQTDIADMNYPLASASARDHAGGIDAGDRKPQRLPAGLMHAWFGEETLCGLAPPSVRLWPNRQWVRNQFSCQECLAAEARTL